MTLQRHQLSWLVIVLASLIPLAGTRGPALSASAAAPPMAGPVAVRAGAERVQVRSTADPIAFAAAYERIDRFVECEMRAENTPGLSLGITSREGLMHVAAYGFADIKARSPVTHDTLFEIGSISKSFTAIALLQLREEGKFDPQAPITRVLPWFSISSGFEPVTGHHLLSHTAGVPRDRDDIPSSVYQAAGVKERSAGYAPGVRFAYSNVGYQILGYALEQITGQPYPDIIRKRIFEPLDMTASEAAITHAMRHRLAVGYERLYDDRPSHPSHPLVPATWLEYAAGDGSISATPGDLAAYLRLLLNRGLGPRGRLLSPESFDLLTQRAIKTGEQAHYGYGLTIREQDGHTLIAHSGGMVGYSAMLLGDLDDGVGVVAFVNGPGSPGRVADFALKAVRAALHAQELPPVPGPDDPAIISNAADYAGIYTAPDGRTLTVVAEGSRLLLEHGGAPVVLERRERDQFFVPHADFGLFPLRFGREKPSGGEAKKEKEPKTPVVEAMHGGDSFFASRYAGPKRFDHPPEWRAYPGHYRTTHAWFNNFRIILRKGRLWLVTPDGGEQAMAPAEPGLFKVGNDEESAERLRLDTIVNGRALRANLSGVDYYRVFTP